MNKINVGVLGPAGTNGHLALEKFRDRFPDLLGDAEIVFADAHDSILLSVENGIFSAGIVPIANSTSGPVGDVISFWTRYYLQSCRVIAEQWLNVDHCLAGFKDRKPIQTIVTRCEAHLQCKSMLNQLALGTDNILADQLVVQYVESTAKAAKIISEDLALSNRAVICSEFTAKLYKLDIIVPNLNDSPENMTRFLLVSSAESDFIDKQRARKRKSACVFALEDKVGALANVLEIFRLLNINVTCLHSVSSGVHGQYKFYLEYETCSKNHDWASVGSLLMIHAQKVQHLGFFNSCDPVRD